MRRKQLQAGNRHYQMKEAAPVALTKQPSQSSHAQNVVGGPAYLAGHSTTMVQRPIQQIHHYLRDLETVPFTLLKESEPGLSWIRFDVLFSIYDVLFRDTDKRYGPVA